MQLPMVSQKLKAKTSHHLIPWLKLLHFIDRVLTHWTQVLITKWSLPTLNAFTIALGSAERVFPMQIQQSFDGPWQRYPYGATSAPTKSRFNILPDTSQFIHHMIASKDRNRTLCQVLNAKYGVQVQILNFEDPEQRDIWTLPGQMQRI
jgi:hypothetical protein